MRHPYLRHPHLLHTPPPRSPPPEGAPYSWRHRAAGKCSGGEHPSSVLDWRAARMAGPLPHGRNERRARVEHRQVPRPQDVGLRLEPRECVRVLPAGQRREEAQAQGISVRRRRVLQRRHRHQGRTREPVGLQADTYPRPPCHPCATTTSPRPLAAAQRHHCLVPTASRRPLRHYPAITVSPPHPRRHRPASTVSPP